MIRHVIDRYDKAIPSVLEIPSKDHPYDPTKDSILRRARVGSIAGLAWGCKFQFENAYGFA